MFFAFRLLLQAVREPPPQHLVQGCKVVRALDRLDAEAAVFLFAGSPSMNTTMLATLKTPCVLEMS